MSQFNTLDAPDTVPLFEFLLDPDLIINHLRKESPQPSAVELLSRLLDVSQNNAFDQLDCGDVLEGAQIRKQRAVQVLTFKVATHLKWDLDVMKSSLSMQKQIILLKDLFAMCYGKMVTIPLPEDFEIEVGPDGDARAAHFVMVLYHRWVLSLQVAKSLASLEQPKRESLPPDIPAQPSVCFLQKFGNSNESFYVLTFDTFLIVPTNSNAPNKNFDAVLEISTAELRTQIYYDLAKYHQHLKQPELAFLAAKTSLENYHILTAELELANSSKVIVDCSFLTITESSLNAMFFMFGLNPGRPTLESRLAFFQTTNLKQINTVLAADNSVDKLSNEVRELAVNKLEWQALRNTLDSQCNADMDAAALNVVNRVIKDVDKRCGEYFEKYEKRAGFLKSLKDAIAHVVPYCSVEAKRRLKVLLTECIIKYGKKEKELVGDLRTLDLFEEHEWKKLEPHYTESELEVPALLMQSDWLCYKKTKSIEIISLKRQIMSCKDADRVKELIMQLKAKGETKPLWSVNPNWEVPTELKQLILSYDPGFLQDFAYALLGKAHEMTVKKDFDIAIRMLYGLKSEILRPDINGQLAQNQILNTALNWEILLIQIKQCLEYWNKKSSKPGALRKLCSQCLMEMQNKEGAKVRIHIIEYSAMLLLNLKNEKTLISITEKLYPTLELPIAVAGIFVEISKNPNPKKYCMDAWNIVLSMFLETSKILSKTTPANPTNLTVATGLQPFLKRIRHPLLFNLTISLIAKIYNILRDDSKHVLSGKYMHLWPISITDAKSYNSQQVSDILHWLLREALKFYPQTLIWLKMQGDLELAMGRNEPAMRCYMELLVTATNNLLSTNQQQVPVNDNLIGKMMICSKNLGYHMQAAVLCQFMKKADYTTCFRHLSANPNNMADPIDIYYNCIWDPFLFEFIINLHSKRGELSRKLEAMSAISQPELNPNNCEDIKASAIKIRKYRILRALAQQYLR